MSGHTGIDILRSASFLDAELKLQSVDPNGSSVECKRLLSQIMSAAGDCRLMISHVVSTEEMDKFREQHQATNEIDQEIQSIVDEIGIDENSSGASLLRRRRSLPLTVVESAWVFELSPVVERNLCASAFAYEHAINAIRTLGESERDRCYMLTRRLGNVRNEMGVYWMNRCAQAIKYPDDENAKVSSQSSLSIDPFTSMLSRTSRSTFERVSTTSIRAFKHSSASTISPMWPC